MNLPLEMLWMWIALSCLVAFLTKWLGFALPTRWLAHPRMSAIAACLTVALLASLTVMNAFAQGGTVTVDARVAALVAAALALWRRWPFLVVVLLGASAAALVRWADRLI